MLLRYFYDPQKSAQASYFVGCQQTSEAIVINPARDVTETLPDHGQSRGHAHCSGDGNPSAC